MKKMVLLFTAILLTGIQMAFSQDKPEGTQKMKNDQAKLPNDVYASYGTGTVYYFTEIDGYVANSLSGTFLVGFARSMNRVIAVGFQLSYTTIDRSQSSYDYQSNKSYSQYMTDNLWQGMANVRFRYMNTPGFCMYSGIGMGVTMDFYDKSNPHYNTSSTGQKLLPAGQLTLLGFRVGHAFSFFGEFGIGTNSIISAGFSYKFAD